MFLFHTFQILAVVSTRELSMHTRFNEKFSLIQPHVGANGRVDFFNFMNEYSNKTRSRKDCTQLGYRASESFGAIVSKNFFTLKDYEISFEFGLNITGKAGKGAGFGFWITDEIKNVPENFGRNAGFRGFGVVIDIENNPQIRFVDAANLYRTGVQIKYIPEETYRLIIQRKSGTVTAKFVQNGKETLLYTGNVKVPREAYLGITSYSGKSSSTLLLEKMLTNVIPTSSEGAHVRKDRGGRSIYIIILGIGAICGLVYYLLKKKPKELIFKK